MPLTAIALDSGYSVSGQTVRGQAGQRRQNVAKLSHQLH